MTSPTALICLTELLLEFALTLNSGCFLEACILRAVLLLLIILHLGQVCCSRRGRDFEETVDGDDELAVDRWDTVVVVINLAGTGSSPFCVALFMQDLMTHAFLSVPGPPNFFMDWQFLHTLQSCVLSRFLQPKQVPHRERLRFNPVAE